MPFDALAQIEGRVIAVKLPVHGQFGQPRRVVSTDVDQAVVRETDQVVSPVAGIVLHRQQVLIAGLLRIAEDEGAAHAVRCHGGIVVCGRRLSCRRSRRRAGCQKAAGCGDDRPLEEVAAREIAGFRVLHVFLLSSTLT